MDPFALFLLIYVLPCLVAIGVYVWTPKRKRSPRKMPRYAPWPDPSDGWAPMAPTPPPPPARTSATVRAPRRVVDDPQPSPTPTASFDPGPWVVPTIFDAPSTPSPDPSPSYDPGPSSDFSGGGGDFGGGGASGDF